MHRHVCTGHAGDDRYGVGYHQGMEFLTSISEYAAVRAAWKFITSLSAGWFWIGGLVMGFVAAFGLIGKRYKKTQKEIEDMKEDIGEIKRKLEEKPKKSQKYDASWTNKGTINNFQLSTMDNPSSDFLVNDLMKEFSHFLRSKGINIEFPSDPARDKPLIKKKKGSSS